MEPQKIATVIREKGIVEFEIPPDLPPGTKIQICNDPSKEDRGGKFRRLLILPVADKN